MIEGLKVAIPTKELQTLCRNRAQYHEDRAKMYRDNLAQLQQFDNPNTSIQPGREAKDKIEKHTTSAAELRFIADHLVDCETYQLDRADLGRIGIGTGW